MSPCEVYVSACVKMASPLSTFSPRSASYLRGRPISGNVQDLAFDRVSAAWDNLRFWGYDEPSTDYSLRIIDIIDSSLWRGRCGASAARAAYRAENDPFRKRLRARRCLLQLHDGPYLRAAVRSDQQRGLRLQGDRSLQKSLCAGPEIAGYRRTPGGDVLEGTADSRCRSGSPGNPEARPGQRAIAAAPGSNLLAKSRRRQLE